MSTAAQSDWLTAERILSTGKWERALFTTYALSLTFFEAHILKGGLARNGCGTIWVIADVDGYQRSLTERRSPGVGQDYHLIPVALPKGVFHPKCIYLSGPEGDVLLVGSGNLTFGGFGRNVEALEVLTAAEHPWVFRSFAEYLRMLGGRKDFLNPDRGWIDMFEDLAFKAAKGAKSAPDQGPHFVHCVDRPIAGQLGEFFTIGDGVSRLRFLSPFFDPDARAVRVVAQTAGCKRVSIGLLPGQEDSSAFPFGTISSKDLTVSAAVIAMAPDTRPLHAKWLEADLADGRRLTLTGSVNATMKSLCSTDNVEVGLVRLQEAKSTRYLEWKPAATPETYEPRAFSRAGLGRRCLVHARFSEASLLEGTILGAQFVEGCWKGSLSDPDGERVDFKANVDAAGKFKVTVSRAEHFVTASAVQIVLKLDAQEARGWLHLDGILNLPRLPRLGISAIVRLVNQQQTSDDDAALLDYFAMSALRHLATFSLEPKAKKSAGALSGEREGDEDLTVDLERLAPAPTTRGAVTTHLGESARSVQALDEMFHRLRRRILSTLAVRPKRGRVRGGVDSTGDDGSKDEEPKPPEEVLTALDRFEAQMSELTERDLPMLDRKNLFTLWFELGFLMRIERLRDLENAYVFSQEWITNASRRCRREAGLSVFDRYFVFLVALQAGNVLVVENSEKAQMGLAQLHEALERYCGGPVASAFATEALVLEGQLGALDQLRQPHASAPAAALESVLATRTFRAEVELVCSTPREFWPADLYLLKSPAGDALAKSREPEFFALRAGSEACPKCHRKLTLSVLNELQAFRLSQCPHCGRFIIQPEVLG